MCNALVAKRLGLSQPTPPNARAPRLIPRSAVSSNRKCSARWRRARPKRAGHMKQHPGKPQRQMGCPQPLPPPPLHPQYRALQTNATTASENLPPIDTVEISSLVSPTDHAPALTKPVLPSKAPDDVAPLDNRQRGKVAAFLILGVLTMIYISAPQITENFPSQTDRINAYVFWVDDLRQWLQHGLQAILDYRMSFSL